MDNGVVADKNADAVDAFPACIESLEFNMGKRTLKDEPTCHSHRTGSSLRLQK
ncbi:hypothetical protein [Prosthecochloris sp.]|uniref:hypothetical protein n=1 Tax=Prosthecochloris sp. TaxID=290513 RepID=UPI00257C043F|nr:hypothetical protein [Prosthecochloris sp.]